MRRRLPIVIATASVWLVAVAAHAQAPDPRGLEIRDSVRLGLTLGSGARALGMGGAFIAVADDGTASSWNPAGLTVLEHPEGSLVWRARDTQTLTTSPFDFRIDLPHETFRRQLGATLESGAARPFDFASFAYPMRAGSWKLVPQVSYQRGIEQGYSRTSTEQTAFSQEVFDAGEFVAGGSIEDRSATAFTTDAHGGIDIWSLGIGVARGQRVSLGLAVNYWRGAGATEERVSTRASTSCTTDFAQGLPTCLRSSETARELTETRQHGTNVNLGVLWHPAAKLRLGLVFKTGFRLKQETTQDGRVADHSDGIPGALPPDDTDAIVRFVQSETIRWPRTIGVGAAFMPRPELTLSLDATTSRWSRSETDFTDSVFNSAAVLTDEQGRPIQHEVAGSGRKLFPSGLPVEADRASAPPADLIRRQPDSYQLRAGAEYVVRRRRFVVPVRAGAFVNRLPVTDGIGRDIRTWGLTAGAGLVWSSLSLDVAYVYERTVYSLDYALDGAQLTCVPEFCETHEEVRSLRDDRFTSGKLYVSTIFRLP